MIRLAPGQSLQSPAFTNLLAGDQAMSMACWFRTDAAFTLSNATIFGTSGALFARGGTSSNFVTFGSPSSFTPTPGQIYHIAFVNSASSIKVYINGALYSIGSSARSADSASRFVVLANALGSGANFDLDDLAIWTHYSLTDADVLALRDRSISPSGTPTGAAWWWTFDGTAGATATAGDAGLANAGSGGVLAFSAISGTPTYRAGNLAYDPPYLESVSIGRSGRTLILHAVQADGTEDSITVAPPTAPTLKVDGVAATLGTPLWGPDSSGKYPRSYVIYPITSGTLDGSESCTVDMPEGWLTTATGTLQGHSGLAVTNRAGTGILPAFDPDASRTLRVGYNLSIPGNYMGSALYANLCKQGGSWSQSNGAAVATTPDGYPSSFATAEAYSYVVGSYANNYDSKGTPCTQAGRWTVRWDGTANCRLVADAGTMTLVSSSTGNATGNYRTYNFTNPVDAYFGAIRVYTDSTNLSNLRVHPPDPASPSDTSLTDADLFHPNLLDRLSGAASIRFMQTQWMSGQYGLANWSDRIQPGDFSYAVRKKIPVSFTSVGPYANADNYFNDYVPTLFTCSAPHGFVTGQPVTISGSSGAMSLTGGGTTTLDGLQGDCRVVDATRFALRIYKGGAPDTVAGTQAITGTASVEVSIGPPVEDLLTLCGAVGADAHICVSGFMTDAEVAKYAAAVAEALPSTCPKLRVELGNERWNRGVPYRFFWHFTEAQARAAGGGMTGRQWYAMRTAQVHDIFAAALAARGKGSKLVRMFGSWAPSTDNTPGGNTSDTYDIVDYCDTHKSDGTAVASGDARRIVIDEIHIAPYYDMRPRGGAGSTGAIWDQFDAEMVGDAGEAHVLWADETAAWVAGHRAILQARYPSASVATYEGGVEVGPAATATDAATAGLRNRAWGRLPVAGDTYLQMLANWDAAGLAVHQHLSLTGTPAGSIWSYGGSSVSDVMWSLYVGETQQAGKGDGSDGKHSNLADYRADGKVEKLDQIVSPTAYALKQWQPGAPLTTFPEMPTDPQVPGSRKVPVKPTPDMMRRKSPSGSGRMQQKPSSRRFVPRSR